MRYKQTIEIGNHIDGIFKLPCVISCNKDDDGSIYFFVNCVNKVRAYVGDKLCEDYYGMWWVESKE